MASDEIDDASWEVILRLQREDFERYDTMKRHRHGEIARDHDVAMKIWAQELDSVEGELPSRKRLRDFWPEPGANDKFDTRDSFRGSQFYSLKRIKRESADESTKSCVVCAEDVSIHEQTKCPCAHIYCRNCLEKMVTVAMDTESQFPPRCCGQVVPRTSIKAAILPSVWHHYKRKEVEFKTPNRMYCYSCAAFIPPNKIENDIGRCSQCWSSTCAICKKKSHFGECPKDEAANKLLSLAKQQRWQRCPSCRNMVEKVSGCMHISCNCGHDFCYGCGSAYTDCQGTCNPNDRDYSPVNDTETDTTEGSLASDSGLDDWLVGVPNDTITRSTQPNCRSDTPWATITGGITCDRCRRFAHPRYRKCEGCGLQTCRQCWLFLASAGRTHVSSERGPRAGAGGASRQPRQH